MDLDKSAADFDFSSSDNTSEGSSSDLLLIPSNALPDWHDGSINKPIQLLWLDKSPDDQNGELIHINPKAITYLNEEINNRQIISICVCGMYRTGKSYLLNLLSGRIGPNRNDAIVEEEENFTVGNTINACTSGLWMWGSMGSSDDSPIYLLFDCEGSSNVDHDQEHDSKLFALAVLLSSYFIYNSKTVIDENAIQTLSVVTSLAEHIQNAQERPDFKHNDAPNFLWVLRDFVLSLEDFGGSPISSSEYLEIALADNVNTSGRSDDTKRARQRLVDLFVKRDCVTLVTPIIDEEKLQNLNNVSYSELRSEFRNQVEYLRDKVFRDACPKSIQTIPVTGRSFVRLIQAYVDAINKGHIPKIESTWTSIQHSECEKLSEECENGYTTEVESTIQLPTDDLVSLLVKLRKVWLNKFKSKALGDRAVVSEFKQALKSKFDNVDLKLIESNKEKFQKNRLENNLDSKVSRGVCLEGGYSDKELTSFEHDIATLKEDYRLNSFSIERAAAFNQVLLPRYEAILTTLKQRVEAREKNEHLQLEREIVEVEEKRRLLEEMQVKESLREEELRLEFEEKRQEREIQKQERDRERDEQFQKEMALKDARMQQLMDEMEQIKLQLKTPPPRPAPKSNKCCVIM